MNNSKLGGQRSRVIEEIVQRDWQKLQWHQDCTISHEWYWKWSLCRRSRHHLGLSFPSSMNAPEALVVGSPRSKGLSSSTGVRDVDCTDAKRESISTLESSEPLINTSSTGLWPCNMSMTSSILGLWEAVYCTHRSPILITRTISSRLVDFWSTFKCSSTSSDNRLSSCNFHACNTRHATSRERERERESLEAVFEVEWNCCINDRIWLNEETMCAFKIRQALRKSCAPSGWWQFIIWNDWAFYF